MSNISTLANLYRLYEDQRRDVSQDRTRSFFGARTRSRTGSNYVDTYSRNTPRPKPIVTPTRPPSAGKVGPRQTTVNDLRRAATYGRGGMTSTPSYPSVDPRRGGLPSAPSGGAFEITPEMARAIEAGIIGGPGAGFGEKYGGFPTQSDFMAAIEGEAMLTRELSDLARMKAEEALGRRSSVYAPEISSQLSSSASMAGVRPGANLSAAERDKLMGGYERVQEMGRTPQYERAREYGTLVNPETGEELNANQLMRMAYESMLEAPSTSDEEQAGLAELAALQDVNIPGVRRLLGDPEVTGPSQIADLIENTPLYEYARQIAQARYGMDPNQAAGLFTPEMDIEYEKQQRDFERTQRGFFPVSEAENIFDMYGQEGYDQYRQMLAEEAMFGTPEQQRAAEEAMIEAENLETDLLIEQNYGFRPSAIPGYSADAVRQAFNDKVFQTAVTNIVKKYAEKQQFTRDDATKIYNDYIKDSGGSASAPINATILEAILKTFNTENPDFG